MQKIIDVIVRTKNFIASCVGGLAIIIAFLALVIIVGGVIGFISSMLILGFEIPILCSLLEIGAQDGSYIGMVLWFIICFVIAGVVIFIKIKGETTSSDRNKADVNFSSKNVASKKQHRDSGFFDGNGTWRHWDEPYRDGAGKLRNPGDSFVDGQGKLRKPGDAWQDSEGHYYHPGEAFRDGKGKWRK